MFAVGHAVTPLSQPIACLSSIFNTLTRVQPRWLSSQSKDTVEISSQQTPSAEQQDLESLANDLGLSYLPTILERPQLFHTSSSSFFENKQGFQERLLDSVQYSNSLQYGGQLLCQKHRPLLNTLWQQVRGFKTRQSTGVGSARQRKVNTSQKKLGSVFDIFKKDNTKNNSEVNKMLNNTELTSDMQEKVRLAFAEGYLAKDKIGTATPKKWGFATLRMVIGLSLFIYLIVLFTPIFGKIEGGMRGIGISNSEVNPEDVKVTFEDVKGADEAKEELLDIVAFLEDPDKFTDVGAKLPKGVLLVGPPGVGKTLLARAVAGEAGVPFFHASGSDFDEMFVGTGAKRVRQLFGAAKRKAPCVIFIDEIDTIGAKRTSSVIHPYANQTINQLLSEMDGFEQNEGVIILGATNKREHLDEALLRPGRFDVEVVISRPDFKGRKEILELYLGKVKCDSSVSSTTLAKGTTGFSGADLQNLVNQAALKAALEHSQYVTNEHMEYARDKVLMGPAKKNKIMDAQTNWVTAYHEAGHTLVAYFTKEATSLHKVTIIPRGASLGHTSFVPDKDEYSKSKSQLMAEMDVAMGGRVAEEVIYGSDKVTTGASSDFSVATAIATAMVKKFGMSDKVGVRVFRDNDADGGLSIIRQNDLSPALTDLIDSEIKRILQESYERAKNILRTHSTEHKALAAALMKYETLDAEDIKAVIDGKPPKIPITVSAPVPPWTIPQTT